MARWAVQFFIFCTVLLLFLVVVGALPIDPDPGDSTTYDCRVYNNSSSPCTLGTQNCARYYITTGHPWSSATLNDTNSDSDPYFSICGGDCVDSNYSINPGQTETCNNIDDDCDGAIDEGGVCVFTVSVSASVSGTTVTLTATTNFGASCKWSTFKTNYDNAPNTMSKIDDFTHTATTTQAVGTTQIYYVYCRSPPP